MSNPIPVCDYEGSDYRARFWQNQGRDYEDGAERVALRRLMPPGGDTLLDVGAGFGRLANEYAGYRRVVLFDYVGSGRSLPAAYDPRRYASLDGYAQDVIEICTALDLQAPVFVGHSEAINIEMERELSAEDAQRILREAPGVVLHDKREDGGYITPVECVGDFATFVSRVREDPTVENGLNLWCVSDNLRKGAALNAVQIAELLGRRHLKKA